MNCFLKPLLLLSRLAIGALFVFSGFVKAIDPMGSNYKFVDYFEAFHLGFFAPLALGLAILLAAAELVIGLCVIAGVRMKVVSWAALVFMSFFTVLTFVLALTNPVSDCGCFGDAIILTNWQTFFKNIILLPIVLFIFAQRKKFTACSPVREWAMMALFFACCFALSAYCLRHLPLIDFLPYRVGQNIPQAMSVPEGAPIDEYKITLIYAKDGVQQEFTQDNYPWQDSTWTFVDSKSVLIRQGYVPPIHNFAIQHPQQGEITEDVLTQEYALLVVAPKIEKSRFKNLERWKSIAQVATDKGYTVVGLTASTQDITHQFAEQHQLNFEFCSVDETTLKSMRIYPGLLLLHHGVIVGKWSQADLPAPEFFADAPLANSIDEQHRQREKSTICALAFALLSLLLGLSARVGVPQKVSAFLRETKKC